MRLRFVPIFMRELRAYFQNPSIYVALAIFLAVTGWFVFTGVTFFRQVCLEQQMQMRYGMFSLNYTEFVVKDTFGIISFLFLFVVPLLTMRLFAEEKRTGTFEVLSTYPITDWGLVVGKFLAAASVIVVYLIVTAVFPLTLGWLGEIEWPVVGTSYLALLCIGLGYAAFGAFASTLTENQIIAAAVTFVGLLVFYLIGDMTPAGGGSVKEVLDALSIRQHSENLIQGKILSEDIFYFIAFTIGFLSLANYVLETRRWRV